MITDKCSIIIEDKNLYYSLISRTTRIIKDKYNCKFTINNLLDLEGFSADEKKYLRSIFSPDINEIDIWGEHHFYCMKNVWEYKESNYYDYRKKVWTIMRLLNNSKIKLGETVYTNDYQLISNLWQVWSSLWENLSYKENRAVIEFLSNNLKNRIGESCRFDFAFVKAFVEARHDYHTKKLLEAIFGINQLNN